MKQARIPTNIFKKYPGKRVAIVEGKVVAASYDAMAAYNIAKKNIPIKKLAFFPSPEKKTNTF